MNTKKLFIEQYEACYNVKNWFPPVMESVEGLTSDQAGIKPANSDHSVLELVHHLIFWNERYLMRFRGETPPPVPQSDKDPSFEIDEKDWIRSVEKLDLIMKSLEEEFKNADEATLQSSPYKDSDDSWYSIFANINIHNAYHIGQIILIRKLIGFWDKK